MLTISLIQKISRSFPKALLLSFENSIIALVRKADYAILEDAVQKELEKLLREHDLKCGISTEFYSFLDLKDYYLQSKYALSEGLSRNHEDVIFYYVDYYKRHIIHLLENATSLKELCHPKIIFLWRSGNPSKKELVRTLYTYLQHGKNISNTANTLFIHRHTLTYRLAKLSEYLEIDLERIDSNTYFYLLVSCMLLVDS